MINVKWRLVGNGHPWLYGCISHYAHILGFLILYGKSTTFIANMCKPSVTTILLLYDESVTSIKNIQIPFVRGATFMVNDG